MQSKKLIQSQFIVKITDIMKEHPAILHWSQNGTELHLANIDIFCEKVLPQYFRHSNFNSFIRQLNIYNFNKTNKVGTSISFKNQIFKKGNQSNFFLIQRKRKFKQLQNFQERFEKQCQDLISQVNNKRQITPQTKEVIINLLQYKYVSYVNLKRMKCQIDGLHKDLKDSRNKKVQEIANQLKAEFLASISQLTSESKKIDEFISQNFLKNRESSETKESLDSIPHEMLYNRYIQPSHNINNNFTKSRSVMKEDQYQRYVSDEIKENFRSFNSFHVFLEEFKTRKEQFTYDHKLYHPFNSQNSFMFIPNYIAAPSHIPYDTKFTGQYQSVLDQNPQCEEKYPTFDNFDQSASISFVKNFGQQKNQVFNPGN